MDNGLFTPQDLEELSARGITPEAAAHQVEELPKVMDQGSVSSWTEE